MILVLPKQQPHKVNCVPVMALCLSCSNFRTFIMIVLLSAVIYAQGADTSLKAYALINHVDNMSVLLAKKIVDQELSL